jgi:DNA-directed RNA polymerase specialized sigma24 family protein
MNKTLTYRMPDLTACQLAEVQEEFTGLLPGIERQARYVFRMVECVHERADRVADAVGLAWRNYLSVRTSDRWAEGMIRSITYYAIRSSQTGEGPHGRPPARCILARAGGRRPVRRLKINADLKKSNDIDPSQTIPAISGDCSASARRTGYFPEEIRSRADDPGALARLRIDWADFVERLHPHQVRVVRLAAEGLACGEIARILGIRPNSVSSVRYGMRLEWVDWHGIAY